MGEMIDSIEKSKRDFIDSFGFSPKSVYLTNIQLSQLRIEVETEYGIYSCPAFNVKDDVNCYISGMRVRRSSLDGPRMTSC